MPLYNTGKNHVWLMDKSRVADGGKVVKGYMGRSSYSENLCLIIIPLPILNFLDSKIILA